MSNIEDGICGKSNFFLILYDFFMAGITFLKHTIHGQGSRSMFLVFDIYCWVEC